MQTLVISPSSVLLGPSTSLSTHWVDGGRVPTCRKLVNFCGSRSHSRIISPIKALRNSSTRQKEIGAVIVPGWFSDCSQYEPMVSYLRTKGLNAVVVPLKWYNWLPSLGGRSVRPILDRINATIDLLLESGTVNSKGYNTSNKSTAENHHRPYAIIDSSRVVVKYGFWDFIREFLNPKNGAQPPFVVSQETEECNEVIHGDLQAETKEQDYSPGKVILIAHSAGGWISRILLGRKVPYDGKTYGAASKVSLLATLGTPHLCTDRLTKRNIDFVNKHCPGPTEKELSVRYFCIAGKFVKGSFQLGGIWKDFAYQSYELCCGKGEVWGDGVVPIECALGLEGAQHLLLKGVQHFPIQDQITEGKWYGTPEVIDNWLPIIFDSKSYLLTSKEDKDLNMKHANVEKLES